MATAIPTLPSFNVSPTPTSYSSTFGGIPGQLQLPASQYQQSTAAVPQLAQLGTQTAGVIGSNLAGQLSPDVINAIKSQGAAWGVAGGTPGSDISANKALSTIGLSSEQLQTQGVGQYNQFLTSLGSQQLSPSLESSIQQQNAMTAAAPDPQQAEQFLQNLLNPPPTHTKITMSGPGGMIF
jgi:hypothetical protein